MKNYYLQKKITFKKCYYAINFNLVKKVLPFVFKRDSILVQKIFILFQKNKNSGKASKD